MVIIVKNKTKNLLIAAGVASAVGAGVTLLTGRLLASAAVRRNGVNFKLPRKLQSKVSGGLTEDPNIPIAAAACEKAKSLSTETVKIKNRDGLELNGHIYMCDSPKRVVLAMHGWRSDWTVDFGGTVDFYHDHGSVMLFPDQRGQNDSDGEYIGFGVLERFDCVDWLKFITERFGEDIPVYLAGVSMGATTVLMASGEQLPKQVKGIIADCGFTSPRAIWKHVLKDNLKINGKLAYPIANSFVKREAAFDGDGYSTTEALSVNEKPVLFIHGTDDRFVPVSMTFENYLACNSKKKMLIVPGAAHGMSCYTDRESYENAVLEFFVECEKV